MKAEGYKINDRPPVKELIPFGVQHALLIAFQALPYPLLVAAGLGFDPHRRRYWCLVPSSSRASRPSCRRSALVPLAEKFP